MPPLRNLLTLYTNLGSWYRSDELAKRSCIFHTSSAIASMISGYLMASVYHLDGRGGLHGWQWLFVVDGIISLPVALAGFFILPDVPEITRAIYFTPSDIALAQKRMALEGRANRQPYTKAKVASIFRSWHIYTLVALYVFFNNGNATGQPIFAQYLKSQSPRYSVPQINVYPTTTYAVQVLTTLLYAWSSDSIFRGARWPPILFAGLVNILCYVSLAVWDLPEGYKWACLILAGCGGGVSGLCMAWAHEICSGDNEERAIVIGSMNEMAYVVQAWLPLLVWQQVDAPEYQKGYITVSFLSAGMIAMAFVIRALWKRERKGRERVSA
jgi:ACS family pantothenate transporter-like MFS transporter